MSKRFVDNETPLNAETLNGLEEDLKRYFSFPVYEAKFSEVYNNTYIYKIAEINWNDIPTGQIFAIKLNVIPQIEDRIIFSMSFNDSSWKCVFYYNITNKTTHDFSYVNELSANKLYLIIKLAESGSSTPLLGLIDHIDTSKFGSTVQVTNGKINLKNICGAVISSADLPYGVEGAAVPNASQTVTGGAKIWLTGTTLNISTIK